MKKNINKVLILLLILLGVVVLWDNLKPGSEVDFSADINPILTKNSISGHGGVTKNGGFSLLFEEEALSTTESGQSAIIQGISSGSEMIKRLTSNDPEQRMHYK